MTVKASQADLIMFALDEFLVLLVMPPRHPVAPECLRVGSWREFQDVKMIG
jgi:hypothetical protein